MHLELKGGMGYATETEKGPRIERALFLSLTMSQEHIEIIRQGFTHLNRALSDPDEASARAAYRQMMADYHEDAELDYTRIMPDFPAARGPEPMLTWFDLMRDAMSGVSVEPVDYIDRGEDVVVPVRMTGRGSASGADVGTTFAYRFRFRGDKVAAATGYQTLKEALEAAAA
jgi:ketosteroid isomerase-like protein